MSGTVSLKSGRAKSALQRHPWIYASALAHVSAGAQDGATVRVLDEAGSFVAWGYLNRRSQIALRLLSWQEAEPPGDAWTYARLERAIMWRSYLSGWQPEGACRLVYAESDGLPGLIVDRYGPFIVVQFLTLGSELWRDTLLAWLRARLDPAGIYERSDVDVREKEGLAPRSGLLWGEMPPAEIEIEEGPVRFLVDVAKGHKTGFYLDQRRNRALVATYAAGREVLDCFAYTGGFSVHAAQAGAAAVWEVDSSVEALRLAARNWKLNGLPAPEERLVEGDVFQVLRAYRDRARAFDMIVLDPPKFAFAQSQVERACRGYKDINRLAMQLLRPGGILATFSCSGAIGLDLFQKVAFGAALDAQREAQIVEVLGQAPDHPVLLSFPEGAYLKGLICRIL